MAHDQLFFGFVTEQKPRAPRWYAREAGTRRTIAYFELCEGQSAKAEAKRAGSMGLRNGGTQPVKTRR